MVDLFSYRLAIILKKSSTECFGNCLKPNSSRNNKSNDKNNLTFL